MSTPNVSLLPIKPHSLSVDTVLLSDDDQYRSLVEDGCYCLSHGGYVPLVICQP